MTPFRYGFESGYEAAHVTDWREHEMEEAYLNDEVGRIASEILENWQQMAGTVYYEWSSSKLDKFEEGFYKGFEKGVRDQLKKKYGKLENVV